MIDPVSALSSRPNVFALSSPRRVPDATRNVETRPHAPISATNLHETLRRFHRLGEAGRVRFALGLLAMSRWRLFRELGFATFLEYARVVFGCDYFQIREYLRVARSLGFLPITLAHCERGELSFEKLGVLASVARPETEEAWIRVAGKETVDELRERALRGRKAPEPEDPASPGFRFPGWYSEDRPLDIYA